MKYKITVNLNRIPASYNIADDFEKARLYHLKHGVDITFNFKNISVYGYSSYHQLAPLNRWLIQGSQNLVSIDNTANVNMFVFDQNEWANPAGSQFPLRPDTPTGSCFVFGNIPFINVGAYIFDHNDGQLWIQIAHEITHSLCQNSNLKGFPVQDVLDTYYHNEDPDYPNGNFAQDWALLQPYIKSQTAQAGWVYFTPTEATGSGHTVAELKTSLVDKLDAARGVAGVPFKITSGFRTPSENHAVGGVPNSAHLTGEAVDISCTDSQNRFSIVKALLNQGFTRIEIAQAHIHADISTTLPQNVIVLSENS